MTNNELSVDSIIKKYEERQEQLTHSVPYHKVSLIATERDLNEDVKHLVDKI